MLSTTHRLLSLIAAATFLLPCDGEAGEACASLSEMALADGGGGGWSPSATAALEGACQRGQGIACAARAGLYDRGAGGPADATRAAALRRRACELGRAESCPGAAPQP